MANDEPQSSQSDKHYVLVTGSNSGLGYAICERLITEFLLTRPASQHLYLLPSTRTQAKADETVRRLQAHIENLVANGPSKKVFFRAGFPPAGFEPSPSLEIRSQFAARVTLDPVLVDLCNLSSVFKCAETLKARLPRLDVLICNAGIGGWDGVSWPGMCKQMVTQGPVEVVSRPNYKISRVGAVTKAQLSGKVSTKINDTEGEPALGEVFTANVFGHYLLVRACLPLLSRTPKQNAQQARVIWTSTSDAFEKFFNIEDPQGLKASDPYEASKRVIDILILGPNINVEAARLKQQYISLESSAQSKDKDMEQSLYIVSDKDLASSSSSYSQASSNSDRTAVTGNGITPPLMLVSHPGVCLTAILPLSIVMTYVQLMVLYVARWLGSIWHCNTPYKGATSAVWLAIESSERLAQENASLKKWGSTVNRRGKEGVIETHMDDYGLAGEHASAKFGDEADRIWVYMEQLRKDWTERLQQKS